MQSKVVKTLALAVLLGTVAVVPAQQATKRIRVDEEEQPAPRAKQQAKKAQVEEEEEAPRAKQKAPPAKSKLEEMLAEALKNNPDIRVAAANVTLAEAELNRIRLQVTQKVVTLYHAVQSQRATVTYEQKQYDRMQGLLESRAIDSTLVEEKIAKLTAAKAKLEELEAQIPALLGKSAQSEANAEAVRTSAALALRLIDKSLDPIAPGQAGRLFLATRESADQHKAIGPMAERLRKALQTPVKVQYKSVSLSDVFKDLNKKVPGLSLRGTTQVSSFTVPDMQFEEALPVSAILQALADDFALRYIVREYGILATSRIIDDVPPGGLTVEEFLRHKPADESRVKFGALMDGVVNSIDAGGLFTISIGSDVGLAKGQTLKLHWKPHKPPIEDARPFGTVRIVEVEAHQAVVQPIGPLSHTPQAGDRIIGSIQKK